MKGPRPVRGLWLVKSHADDAAHADYIATIYMANADNDEHGHVASASLMVPTSIGLMRIAWRLCV